MAFTAASFFRLIRYPNLLMSALAIWVHWHFLIARPLSMIHQPTLMNFWIILGVGLSFALVMGGGFVINDIFDEKIDRINKGDRQILGNSISLKWAWKLYWILNTLAMLATYVIAYQLELLKYVFLLPLSVILLYFYSSRLKKTAFLGNLCIAILCGFVLWIPFLGESSGLNVIQKNTVSAQFFYCSVVAFFLTLSRELIKDIQDIDGDKAGGARTVPIIWSTKKTFRLVITLIIITIISLLTGIFYFDFNWIGILLITVSLLGPLLIMLYKLLGECSHSYMGRYSTLVKILMAVGMILLPMCLSIFRR